MEKDIQKSIKVSRSIYIDIDLYNVVREQSELYGFSSISELLVSVLKKIVLNGNYRDYLPDIADVGETDGIDG